MKKIVLTLAVFALALTCAFSSFAYFGLVTWDEPVTLNDDGSSLLDGRSLNDDSIDLNTNLMRKAWTASRGFPKENAMFTDLGGNVCVLLSDTEYITNDPDTDGALAGTVYIAIDLKVVKPGDFCGMVVDCTDDTGYNTGSGNSLELDDNGYIHGSGYGFKLVEGNKIRAFINGSKAVYADIELGFDAAADFHNYAIYRDAENYYAFLVVDDYYVAKFDFSASGSKMGIYGADGSLLAGDAEDQMNETGHVWVATVGECEVYLDNMDYQDYVDEPEPAKTSGSATAAPADATDTPADATEVPADPTEAPADPTEAPADPTEAPADPTKAPADPTAEPKKDGCGSIVSGGAAVLAAACVVFLRKKEC